MGGREVEKQAEKARKLTRFIKDEALTQGFDLCRITGPDSIPEAAGHLSTFLREGRHGSMDWMAETEERRGTPRALWPDVKSIVLLAMNYGPDMDPRYLQAKTDKAHISVYARNRDYHDVIKGRLKEMATRFAARSGADVKVFVDTAPVMEKPLAAAAGLGWQGKHTNLVSRDFGSWLFLGSIFTTATLDVDPAEEDHCGRCRACLDACPTDAFPAPYQIDARRCISYLTIEHKGAIDPALRPLFGNRIYGCDDCLAACPWNKFAKAASDMRLAARPDLKEPDIAHLLTLDDTAFRTLFSGSPVKRIGRERFIRNVLIAAGNSSQQALIEPVAARLDDVSPTVRAMAVWALSRLDALSRFRHARNAETDETVLHEWDRAGE